MRRQFGQRCIRPCTAGRGIGDDAHPMSTGGLTTRQVANVAEQSTDRRAQDMQDGKGHSHSPFILS
jgi:hypothetical protein